MSLEIKSHQPDNISGSQITVDAPEMKGVSKDHWGPEGSPPKERTPLLGPPGYPEVSFTTSPKPSSK